MKRSCRPRRKTPLSVDIKRAKVQLCEAVRKHWRIVLSRLLFLLGPFVLLCAVETLNERNPFTNLNAEEWWMNLALYYMLWVFLWLLLGRRRSTVTVGTLFFTAVGLVNHYVLQYMGRILFPNDLVGARTAANVATNYTFAPDYYVAGALTISVVYLLLCLCVMPKQPKRSYFRRKWLNALSLAAAAGYCVAFFFSPWLLEAGIRTQQWMTQSNGFVLNFSIALRYSRVEKPSGYSRSEVERLVGEWSDEAESELALYKDPFTSSPYDKDTQDEEDAQLGTQLSVGTGSKQPVNIICIMDESFADMSIYDKMSTAEDSVPLFHRLRKNTIKGWMYSTVTGGGTATVEYEFLTGNPAAFLPMGTVAYQLYVKDGQPSLFSWAKALGFETTAFHPYEASGWNRTSVYSYFGADHQLYQEDVKAPELIRSYISDKSDFQTIMDITDREQGDPQFIFNVTMQNHGGYAQGWDNLERHAQLSGELKGVSANTNQYLSLMYATDEALRELLLHYYHAEEPTLILVFGDHQGKLSSEFYNRLYGGRISEERTLAETEKQYIVPFLLWANYDIAEAQDVMLSTNYLGALLSQVSGYPMTDYQRFLTRLYPLLPVINRMSYVNSDGLITDKKTDLTEEQQERLRQYHVLSYHNLFHRDEEIDGFFQLRGED